MRIDEDFGRYFIEYFKLIQNVITRMASNSLILKIGAAAVFSAVIVLLSRNFG